VLFRYFRNPDMEALAYLYDDTVPRLATDLRLMVPSGELVVGKPSLS